MERKTLIAAIGFVGISILLNVPALAVDLAPAKPPVKQNGDKPVDAHDEPPAVEEIQTAFEQGAYEETLKLLSKALPLKGKAAEKYDRYALLMLKANTHLKLKAQAPAVQALGDAAEATKDATEGATARATATLVKRSKGLMYVPKSSKDKNGAKPIDVTDPAQRKAAINALWADELARVEPKIKAAAGGRTLPPIADALNEIKDLKDVELAAAGSDEATKEMALKLSDRAFSLMDKEMGRISKRVADIEKSAETIERTRVPITTNIGQSFVEREQRRGLRGGETTELRKYVADAPPIAASAEQLGTLSGSTAKADKIIDAATTAVETAKRLLQRG